MFELRGSSWGSQGEQRIEVFEKIHKKNRGGGGGGSGGVRVGGQNGCDTELKFL